MPALEDVHEREERASRFAALVLLRVATIRLFDMFVPMTEFHSPTIDRMFSRMM